MQINHSYFNFSIVLNKLDSIKNLENNQISSTLDAILAIYNTPMNIYHYFVFNLVYRRYEVLIQQISKRYSKHHFLYVCQSHPCTKQTARHGISKSKYIHYFLIIQNLSQLFFMFCNIKNSVCKNKRNFNFQVF